MLLPWLRNQNLTISVPVRLFRFAFDLKFWKSRNVDLIWKGDLKLMNNGHIIATSRHVYRVCQCKISNICLLLISFFKIWQRFELPHIQCVGLDIGNWKYRLHIHIKACKTNLYCKTIYLNIFEMPHIQCVGLDIGNWKYRLHIHI